jgi:hypothetical protein
MKKNARCRKATLAIAALLVAGALYPMTALGGQKLIVKDSGGQVNKFVISDDGTGLSAPDNGFVGIGTATPARAIQIEGATISSAAIYAHYTGTNAAGGGGLILSHNNASGAFPATGDRLGYVLFSGIDNVFAGGRSLNGAGITARTEGAWSSDGASNIAFPTGFAFETTAANSRTEKMRITGSGNVGIGTSTPTSKLQVVGLPVYANNLAAVNGGLSVGAFYRTGLDPDQVCVVH